MNIEVYGMEKRMRAAARHLAKSEALLPVSHIMLLPIPTAKDKQHITGTDIPLRDVLQKNSEGSLTVGYGVPSEYAELIRRLGGELLDLAFDEDFLVENAYITAVGALAEMIASASSMPRDSSFGIYGYGRIGRELLKLLLFLGASVTVYTSSEKTYDALVKSGVKCVKTERSSGGVCDFSHIDTLINTAPCDMREVMDNAIFGSSQTKIYELASGDNFPEGFNVRKMQGVPEKMLPESAGYAVFCAVKRYLDTDELTLERRPSL